MKWLVCAAAVITASPLAGPAEAQPGVAQDSVRLLDRDRLLALRDTVRRVTTAIVGFRRNLGSAGAETVTHKARTLVQACGSARAALVDAAPLFGRRDPAGEARLAGDSLEAALHRMAAALDEHCIAGLAPDGPGQRADSLRAWGPYRTGQLRQAIDRFHTGLHRFAAANRIRLPRPASS